MAFSPLSTYMTWPVTPEARGEHRKAAQLPTCDFQEVSRLSGGVRAWQLKDAKRLRCASLTCSRSVVYFDCRTNRAPIFWLQLKFSRSHCIKAHNKTLLKCAFICKGEGFFMAACAQSPDCLQSI